MEKESNNFAVVDSLVYPLFFNYRKKLCDLNMDDNIYPYGESIPNQYNPIPLVFSSLES